MRRLSCGVATLTICIGSVGCRSPWQPVAAEFTSPKGTYTVKLRGHLSAPRSPFFEHYVYLEAFKGDEPLITGYEIHFADWFDTAFEDMYDGHEWLAESALRIKWTGGSNEGYVQRELVVENQSSKPVRFLRVRANELFFLLDLAPHSATTLSAWHRDDACYVAVAGLWADGSPLLEQSANFPHPGSGARHVRVVIDERGIQIR